MRSTTSYESKSPHGYNTKIPNKPTYRPANAGSNYNTKIRCSSNYQAETYHRT